MNLGNPIRHNGLLYHHEGESMNKIINIYGSDQDPPPTSDHESGKLIWTTIPSVVPLQYYVVHCSDKTL